MLPLAALRARDKSGLSSIQSHSSALHLPFPTEVAPLETHRQHYSSIFAALQRAPSLLPLYELTGDIHACAPRGTGEMTLGGPAREFFGAPAAPTTRVTSLPLEATHTIAPDSATRSSAPLEPALIPMLGYSSRCGRRAHR
jgi:hypothetical protein